MIVKFHENNEILVVGHCGMGTTGFKGVVGKTRWLKQCQVRALSGLRSWFISVMASRSSSSGSSSRFLSSSPKMVNTATSPQQPPIYYAVYFGMKHGVVYDSGYFGKEYNNTRKHGKRVPQLYLRNRRAHVVQDCLAR